MMLGAYDFEILNEIGIAQSVMEKLENSKFFNKNGEFLEISEINSLEELMDFMDEVNESIVLRESWIDSKTPCLEIYDDYRE